MKILSASTLLPISGPPIQNGSVVIENGEIIACGPTDQILKKYPDATPENFEKSVLMPGLVNPHTQLELGGFEPKEAQFIPWLIASWEHRQRLAPAERRNAFTDGVKQLIRSGTTCIGDTGNYAGLVPTVRNLPIRAVLFPEIFSSGGTADQYEAAFAQVDEIRSGGSRIEAGIAPYAPYTLSRNLLKIIAQQAAAAKLPLKIHAAESFSEMQFFYESKGEIADDLFPRLGWKEELPPPHRKTPIQFLESIGLLGKETILIGCVQLGTTDLKAIAQAGVRVVVNPRGNARLKFGAIPLKKMLRAGIPIGIGTDGVCDSLSLWDELRLLSEGATKEGAVMPGQLLELATLGGAKVLGLEKKIGSIEKGKRADLIVVDVPSKMTVSDLPAWLVRNVNDQRIKSVFIDGEKVDARKF